MLDANNKKNSLYGFTMRRRYALNEWRYIFSWLLIIVGVGIGWYMSFPKKKSLEEQKLIREAKYAKFIGYSYIIASIIAMIAYRT